MNNNTNYEEMNFAKLDTNREERTGFPEVVFCEGKTDEHLVEIYKKLYEKDGRVFGTRASMKKFRRFYLRQSMIRYPEF